MAMTKPTSEQVTFLQTGTGATARTVDAKLKDTVSVKDFGAVGDGVADDTAAIQAAINTNKEVFVPNGTYNLSASLTMTLNQQIRGESSELTKIKTTTAVNAITVADSAYCVISDLYFDGNSIGLVGIKVGLGVTFSAFHEIRNCKIYNFTSHGIHLNGTSYCLIENCFIRLNGGNGIYNNLGSPSGYGNANTISNCQIWDNITYGIQLYRANNNIIQNTRFVLGTGGTSLTVGNRTANIYINNTHDTTIDKCEFENVDFGFTTYNILIDDTDGATLPNTVNNKIRDCRFVGAALNCSYNVAIGLVGAVYSTEMVSTTFVRSVNEDIYLGQYANNTVIDDCIHRFTYDTPLSGENATVYNPFSLKYTLFEFGNQSRGTFTPIFQTSTGGTNWSSTYYATTRGFYTKIQNIVNFSLVVHVNAIAASGAGALIITGLPFECWDNGVPASLSISGLLALTTPLTYNVNVRARLKRSTYVDRSISNSTVIELFYGANNDTPLPSAQINNGHYMVLSGSYLTNVI